MPETTISQRSPLADYFDDQMIFKPMYRLFWRFIVA